MSRSRIHGFTTMVHPSLALGQANKHPKWSWLRPNNDDFAPRNWSWRACERMVHSQGYVAQTDPRRHEARLLRGSDVASAAGSAGPRKLMNDALGGNWWWMMVVRVGIQPKIAMVDDGYWCLLVGNDGLRFLMMVTSAICSDAGEDGECKPRKHRAPKGADEMMGDPPALSATGTARLDKNLFGYCISSGYFGTISESLFG